MGIKKSNLPFIGKIMEEDQDFIIIDLDNFMQELKGFAESIKNKSVEEIENDVKRLKTLLHESNV